MNTGGGHQATIEASKYLRKEVRQNIKDKKESKVLWRETHPGEGVVKEEEISHSRKTSHKCVYGEMWNLRGQHNEEEKN